MPLHAFVHASNWAAFSRSTDTRCASSAPDSVMPSSERHLDLHSSRFRRPSPPSLTTSKTQTSALSAPPWVCSTSVLAPVSAPLTAFACAAPPRKRYLVGLRSALPPVPGLRLQCATAMISTKSEGTRDARVRENGGIGGPCYAAQPIEQAEGAPQYRCLPDSTLSRQCTASIPCPGNSPCVAGLCRPSASTE